MSDQRYEKGIKKIQEFTKMHNSENPTGVLTTISSLVSQGLPQISIHINSGLNVGLTPEEIIGCIMHLLPYAGFPRVLNALTVAKEIFEERGIKVNTAE